VKVVSATYDSGEIEVAFTAQTAKCDYGVERSPVWDEVQPETVEITYVKILGVVVEPHKLPNDLRTAVHALAEEVEFE
tara:strand:- start:159 stop:392 length:234 start_codon:yes stop_codon:yes gene_type:complete